VDDYVNIRQKPDEESEILGKLFKNSAATVLEEDDVWCKVKSGTVTGYIKLDFLATGKEAEKLSEQVGQTVATVTAKTLRLRSQASTNSKVVTLLPKGDTYEVTKEREDWVKIKVDSDTSGYVSSDYVRLSKKYEEAVSVKEEKAVGIRMASTASDNSEVVPTLRDKIVNFAVKFVGNPYRWGGTSLTNGADCSGFTQSVFEKYGIDLPRTSREQAASGRRVNLDELRPGDLIFYRRDGSINHVALYIGNGKVISAKSPSEGIMIKNYNYRTPYKAVSYIG
jgi:cell wall-associated NlpC family hydrolase